MDLQALNVAHKIDKSIFEIMKIIEYSSEFKDEVKGFVIRAHEEFRFSYNIKLDYDLDDIDKNYKLSGGIFYLLINNSKIIGTVAIKKITDEIAELKRLYVDKKYRRKGWGSSLVKKALQFSLDKKFSRVILDTNIKQLAAQELYKKNGFLIEEKKNNTIYMFKNL